MKQGIGEIATLNIIIIFIVIVFGLLSATISYYKAFKVNTRILDRIEKYEGYNDFSRSEIERSLDTIGYVKNNNGSFTCPSIRINGESVSTVSSHDDSNIDQGNSHYYCVYYQRNDGSTRNGVNGQSSDSNRTNLDMEPIYYNYIVVTYIFVDLPIVGQFKVPVRTKGERTYNFSEKAGNPIIK